MIELPFTFDDLQLLKTAIEKAESIGWPGNYNEKFRLSRLKKQVENGIAELNKDRWQGFNR